MTRRISLLTAAAVIALCGALTPAAYADGNVNFLLGQSERDNTFAPNRENIQEQDTLGVLFDWGPEDWPVNLALDIITSNKDTRGDSFDPADADGNVLELLVGAKKYFMEDNPFRPYVAAGIGLVSGEVKTTNVSIALDDQAFAYYVNGGLMWRIGERFNLGGDVRWTKAELSAEDTSNPGSQRDVEAGGLTYGVTLGFGW